MSTYIIVGLGHGLVYPLESNDVAGLGQTIECSIGLSYPIPFLGLFENAAQPDSSWATKNVPEIIMNIKTEKYRYCLIEVHFFLRPRLQRFDLAMYYISWGDLSLWINKKHCIV